MTTGRDAAAIDYAIAMLKLIAGERCESFMLPHGACEQQGRKLGAYYSAEGWCHACIAASALKVLSGPTPPTVDLFERLRSELQVAFRYQSDVWTIVDGLEVRLREAEARPQP